MTIEVIVVFGTFAQFAWIGSMIDNAIGIAMSPNLNDVLQNFSTSFRDRFSCGFRQMNMPALDPFFLSNYSTHLNQIGDLTE